MAALGSPARTLRGLLRELRYMNAATGRPYRDTAAYRYLVKAFRAHRVRKPLSGMGGRVRNGRAKRAPSHGACRSWADPPTQSDSGQTTLRPSWSTALARGLTQDARESAVARGWSRFRGFHWLSFAQTMGGGSRIGK